MEMQRTLFTSISVLLYLVMAFGGHSWKLLYKNG